MTGLEEFSTEQLVTAMLSRADFDPVAVIDGLAARGVIFDDAKDRPVSIDDVEAVLKCATIMQLIEELTSRPWPKVADAAELHNPPFVVLPKASFEDQLNREHHRGYVGGKNDAERAATASLDNLRHQVAELNVKLSAADSLRLRVVELEARIDRFTSSCEVGTPSKAGVAKCYFDPANEAEAIERAKVALRVREFMMGNGGAGNV